jgi:nucleotide-binding universal stress UspA family protein
MKTILLPTDFSKPAGTAAEVAADIARRSNSTLIILHVIEELMGDSFSVMGQTGYNDFEDKLFTMAMIEKSKKQFAKLQNDPMFKGIKIKAELRLGNPFHGIKSIVTEHKVDLVVMGTGGRTKAEEVIIGSNTERIVRHARCPVLSLHKKPDSLNFKNIVYATAMSKDEEVFTRIVRSAQRFYDATVHLVRINTPGNFQRDSVVKKYMVNFAKEHQFRNYTINVYNDLNEEEGIVYFADSINADMIAMATHGRSGFAHILAGSVAEDVVSHSKRPVLTWVVKH